MGKNDIALQAVQAALGASATILQHLPDDKVKIESFDDKKNDRPNTVPFRMLFGHIKEGQDKGNSVWILLQFNHSVDRSPSHFWNVFDRHGRLLRQVNAEEAVRRTDPATPFKFLKISGDMDEDQLRAVTRFYFIKKGISTSFPWIVGDLFIKSLGAACLAAKKYEEKVAASRETQNSREQAAQRPYALNPKPSVSQSHEMENNGVSAKTGQGSATVNSSITGSIPLVIAKARRTPQLQNLQRAPTASMVPLTNEASSLFIPEDPNVKTTSDLSMDTALNKIQGIQAVLKARKTSVSNPHVVASTASSSHDRAETDASRTMPTRTRSMEVLNEKSPNSQSPDNFVSAYRKCTTDRDAIKDEIKAIEREQNEMEVKLAELKDRKHQRKEALQLTGAGRKRLRDSLSGKELALIALGMELAEKKLKRSKTSAQSEEGSSGDEG